MATKFRYLKWQVTKKRATGSVAVQASEFQLLDRSGNAYVWPSGTTVTSTPVEDAIDELASNLIDGETSTKLCVRIGWDSTTSQTGDLEVIFDVGFGNEINLSKRNRYCYYTANDEESRDPISWTLYGSNDASDWEVLDTQSDLSNIPTTRYTQAGIWEMDVEPEDYIFQPGIVGKTNVVEGAVIPNFGEQLVNYRMLYYLGDECEDVTDGWIPYNGNTSKFTLTKNEDNLYCNATILSGAGDTVTGYWATKEKVDLTDYSRIVARMTHNQGYSSEAYCRTNVYISSGNTGYSFTDGATLIATGAASFDGVYVANLSGVTYKNGYIRVQRRAYSASVAGYYNLYAMALTKADYYNALCDKAGISTFATVDELIADTTAISAILSNESAVRFMVKRCTGDFMALFVANSSCISLLESSPHKEKVYANEHWAKFLAMVA